MVRKSPKRQFLTAFSFFICFLHFKCKFDNENKNIHAIGIVEKLGYPLETHQTETEDGYILKLHRIPHGKFSHSRKRIPVLIQHGLFSSSDKYLRLKDQSISFLLADAGYDVWLGNFRGNKYSTTHKYLSPENPKFWDFSMHENGMYDFPAIIDYVCKFTRHKELLLIAHSMSSTAFFIMTSVRPEYQKKLRGVIQLAPVARVKNMRNNLPLFASYIKPLSPFFRNGKCGTTPFEHKNSNREICALAERSPACKNLMTSLFRRGNSEYDEDLMLMFLKDYFGNMSIKSLLHYKQLMDSGKFEQFDYGYFENWRKYNQSSPPEYKLESVTVPLSVFLSQNDSFVSKSDIRYLLERLNSVKSIYLIPDRTFGHLSFSIGKNAKQLVYDKVLEEMEFLIKHGKHAKSIKNFEHIYEKIL